MVYGFESFKNWFTGYKNQYTIIGGTACDILLNNMGLDFRATKDIDMVLIVNALTLGFGNRFWEYIKAGGYSYINKNTGKPQFYRFSSPVNDGYPKMIELFSRTPDNIIISKESVISPVQMNDEVSDLSAIILDEDYYHLFETGRIIINDIPILDAGYLLLLKAKAWLDLSNRKSAGESVDSRDILKHKKDVLLLSTLLTPETKISVSKKVYTDLMAFLSAVSNEDIKLKQSNITSIDKFAEIIKITYITE